MVYSCPVLDPLPWMLLVPRQVGVAVLFQPEVEGTLLTTIEALVRVHIGIPAVRYLAA